MHISVPHALISHTFSNNVKRTPRPFNRCKGSALLANTAIQFGHLMLVETQGATRSGRSGAYPVDSEW